MSSVGLYGFDIPHDYVRPTRDMVIIRIPFPPRKIGNMIVPQQSRDLLAHNVMAGRIVAMGPLAFAYKDGSEDGKGLSKQDVKIGDWVLFRPFAGTMIQGGQIMVTSGWRYISSFSDVIGIVPGDKMPDADTLLWEENDEAGTAAPKTAELAENIRERVVYKK